MARRSNNSVAEILNTSPISPAAAKVHASSSSPFRNDVIDDDFTFEGKVILATEDSTDKFCKLVLKDRSRLSKENSLAVCEYIIAMKREINPRLSYKRYTIQFLSELSRSVGIKKKFVDMTRDDILCYLDKCRKTEDDDALHKWIGTYNTKLVVLSRFFKWLHYPDIDDSKIRNELSAFEKKPDCIMGIKQLKRKEISCYKPSDLWSQEDDLVFLKWVTNRRDRCYHTMARDLSARPHEILSLKIKDIVFKNVGNKQFAEVLVNGKTGSRPIPLIQSIPYLKDWLSDHPSRNNPNSPLFVGLGRNSMGRRLNSHGVYEIYKDYKAKFFPKLLENNTIPNEDKEKIKMLLTKPFNPYIRRHSALTEKSTKLKSSTLNQHAGWHIDVAGHFKRDRATHWKAKREGMQQMSTKMQQQVEWRRTKVMELLSKGEGNQSEIARILQVDKSIISRDIAYLRQQSKTNIKRYIDERLPEEYEKCLVGLTAITKEAWNTAANTEDKREKMQA
jgi:integrase